MTSQNTLVSLFIPSLGGGGAERVALNLACGFVERGLKVDVVLNNAIGPFLTKVPSEVRVISLKTSKSLPKLLALARYLKREQPTALFSLLDNVNVAGLAKLIAGVSTQVVVGVHNTYSKSFLQGIKGRLKPFLVQKTYPLADGIIAVSQGVADDLARMSGLSVKDIQVIYNPVVTPDLTEKAKEPVDHPWFSPGEPPVILGIGRLTDQKDFPTLIQAFALMRQQRRVRLMILGEGEKRAKLEALIAELGLEDDIALPGFVENPFAYLSKAAVFALSSIMEGLPTVLIEAIAVGTPVVSTDCPSGPVEILEGGKYGKLVPVGDVSGLAEAIAYTLNYPTNPELLWHRSQSFCVDRAVEQYLEVLSR